MGLADNLKRGMASAEVAPIQGNVTEKEYHIDPKLKRDLDGIIATCRKIDDFGTEMGHRNYIFSGPPGTGKTLGVRYVATVLNFPVYDAKLVSNPQQVGQLYGQLREQARNQPVIVLMDEIDRFSSRDEIVDPTQQQTLNQLLTEMDGTESNHGIFVFGTTNKPDKVDNALRRPGRFSKEIAFMPPNKDGRLTILKIHADGKGGHKFKVRNEDLQHAADVTYGYTGADLVGLLNEAFTSATLDDRTEVNQSDFEYALVRTKPSALRDMPFVEPKKKLKDIGGYQDHKELVRRVMENSNGALFLCYGPGGTGKSLLPEAVAGEYGYNFIVVHGNDPEDSLVGKTKDRLKKYVERATQLAPCVLLLDEIGSLVAQKVWTGGTKEGHTGYLQSVLSHPPEGVYIFATENDPDRLLDPFVQRFPYKLFFDMPPREDQLEIWKKYLPEGIDPEVLVGTNDKLTGRDIEQTTRLVKDYGLEPSVEVYQHLVKDKQYQDGNKYESTRSKGDSIADFRRVKALKTEKK